MRFITRRYRWVVMKDGEELFCGSAPKYKFVHIDNIKDEPIKSYVSEDRARASFVRSWATALDLIKEGRIEFVHIVESIGTPEYFVRFIDIQHA